MPKLQATAGGSRTGATPLRVEYRSEISPSALVYGLQSKPRKFLDIFVQKTTGFVAHLNLDILEKRRR